MITSLGLIFQRESGEIAAVLSHKVYCITAKEKVKKNQHSLLMSASNFIRMFLPPVRLFFL